MTLRGSVVVRGMPGIGLFRPWPCCPETGCVAHNECEHGAAVVRAWQEGVHGRVE